MYQEQQTFIPFTEFYNDLPFIKTEPSLSLQHPHQLLLTESFHPIINNNITTFTSNSVKQQQDVFFLDDFEYLYNPMDNLNSNYTGITEYNSGDSFTSSPSSSMCSVLENDFYSFPTSPSPSLSTPPPPPIQIEEQKQTQSQMYTFSVKEKEEKAKSLSPCQHNAHKKSNQHQHQLTMIPSISQKNNNRMFACHLCFRQFARKHDLQRHIRVHTGVKPYSCLNCSKSFVRTDALKRHLRLDENCKKSPIIQAMAKSGNRRYQNL